MSAVVVLSDLAAQINREHEAAEKDAASAVEHARRAGELLLQAKAKCAHGEWLPWLKANCPDISQRSAQGYMRLARYCLKDPRNVEDIEALPLRDALTYLAAPKYATRCAFAEDDDPTFFNTCIAHLEEWARQEWRLQGLQAEFDAIDHELDAGSDDDRKAQHLQRLTEICRDVGREADIATLRLRMDYHLSRAFNAGMSLAEALGAEPAAMAAALGVDAGVSLKDWLTRGVPIPAVPA